MIRLIILITYFISLYFIAFWLLVYAERGIEKEKPSAKIKKSKADKVTICIPAYNEEKNIVGVMRSVLRLDYPESKVELIVVDDGSTDRTGEKVKEIIKKNPGRNIKLIRQKNKGKAAAMNAGLRIASGKLFISMDADSVIKKNALRKIFPYFDDPDVTAVLPIIRVLHKKTIMQKIQHCEYLINFFYKKIMHLLDCVHVTPGPFSVYKKNVIKKLGGFDENNLVEDLEMAFRLQKYDYKIVQLLGPCALTKAPATFGQFYKQRNRWYKGSLLNLFNRKYRGMMFNHKYGDLGVFQFPMIIISALLSLIIVFLLLGVYIIKPLIISIRNVSYVNFDLIPLVQNFLSKFSWIDINFVPLFYGATIFGLALVFITMAHHYTKESLIKNRGYILLYFIIYPFLISIVWLGIIFDLIIGKRQRW